MSVCIHIISKFVEIILKQDAMFPLQLLFFDQELKTSPARAAGNKFLTKQLLWTLF